MAKSLGNILLDPINAVYKGRSVIGDQAYGSDSDMRYDEYPVDNATAPLVIFWHGGSWKTGNKSMYRFVGSRLQSIGAHAFIVDYPKFPKRSFPGFIEDSVQCVKVIKAKYPDRQIIVMGHSAGANTAMLTALESELAITKAVSLAGVCTLNPKYWRPVFGPAIDDKSYDPREHLQSANQQTKFLIIHGLLDYIVPVSDSIKLHKMLVKSGRSSQLILLRLAEHITILPGILIGPRLLTKKRLKKFILS